MKQIFCCLIVPLALLSMAASTEADEARDTPVTSTAHEAIIALYDFSETSGSWVRDVSGVGAAADLKISDSAHVLRQEGSLQIIDDVRIQSEQPPKKLIAALQRTASLTVEVWMATAKLNQRGPARIITISKDGSHRNVTLGQEGDRFEVRLRTTETSENGLPALRSPADSVKRELTHVVYSRDAEGRAAIYVDGDLVEEGKVEGGFGNWQDYRIAIGNELSGDRQWLGELQRIAFYYRALTAEEIRASFETGPHSESTRAERAAKQQQLAASRHFESVVAPLLSNHCLECHDSATAQGDLDLSKKAAAFAGGESGEAITAGDSQASLFWQMVESDEMPKERPALSADEKAVLKKWIDQGANWTLDFIDPAVYAHGGGTQANFLRRLTTSEYIRSVESVVGIDIQSDAQQLLPKDLRADGFSNTAYNLNVDLKNVDAYAQLARIIVERMDVAAYAKQFRRKPKFTDNAMGDLISSMGARILRGPLDDDEVISYRGISTGVAAAGGTYDEAIGLILEAMLQSPRFLYRVEDQRAGELPVSQYELATRLGYLVLGAPADDKLWTAAKKGRLTNDANIAAQVKRMLADPRAVQRSREFLSEWLNLGRLDNLRPNAERFPNWKPDLARDMQQETLAYFEEIVWKQRLPLSELLHAQFTFATPALAEHYGLEGAGEPSGLDGMHRYDLRQTTGRGGLLTQGSVLTVGGDEASMVTRGLLVMHELLRGVVKDPPPCVNTTPIPTRPGVTQRTIALDRLANTSCKGCHAKFEPLAFGLEKFDGLGTWHEQDEHGNTLREDGEILFPGSKTSVQFQTASELMRLLAESDRVRQSVTWKLTQFAMGRPLTAVDAAELARIHEQSQAAGGTYQSLISAIATSKLMRTSGPSY